MTDSNIQPELISLKSKLVNEIEKDEKVVESATKRIEANKTLLHAVNGSLGAIVAEVTGYGGLAETVRAAIEALEKAVFVPHDIEREIRAQHPAAPLNKPGVRRTLWTFAEKGEIKLLRKGNNREPAQYERIHRFKRVGGSNEEQAKRQVVQPDLVPNETKVSE